MQSCKLGIEYILKYSGIISTKPDKVKDPG